MVAVSPPDGSTAPDRRQAGQSFSVDAAGITAPQRWHLSFSEAFHVHQLFLKETGQGGYSLLKTSTR